MTERYLWKVYCLGPPGRYETIISETEPVTCPSGGPIDPSETIKLQSLFIDISTPGYVNLESSLADNQAIKIQASSQFGGIDIDAGAGGITMDTPNSILLNAGAQSTFATSNGNLEFEAELGLLNLRAGSGINIGSVTTPVINVQAGSGGINLDTTGQISLDSTGSANNWTATSTGDGQNLTLALLGSTQSKIELISQGTGEDSIRLLTVGGIDVDASSTINLASASSSGAAIMLDAAFNNGGINLSAGSQGIAINSTTSIIGIGHWSGTDVLIGTAPISRVITIGNATGSTRLVERWGSGGHVEHQEEPVSLPDSDSTLLVSQLLVGLIVISPTSDVELTLPSFNDLLNGLGGGTLEGDSVKFTIINTSLTNFVVLIPGLGGSIVGNESIVPNSSASWTLRMGIGTSSYVLYRLS